MTCHTQFHALSPAVCHLKLGDMDQGNTDSVGSKLSGTTLSTVERSRDSLSGILFAFHILFFGQLGAHVNFSLFSRAEVLLTLLTQCLVCIFQQVGSLLTPIYTYTDECRYHTPDYIDSTTDP